MVYNQHDLATKSQESVELEHAEKTSAEWGWAVAPSGPHPTLPTLT